jgi:ABC-type branched-subunit amino acid transport system ATPase component
LPFSSNPDLRKNVFYQQFYENNVQDVLRGRPNKQNEFQYEKLEKIWQQFPKVKSMKKSVSLIASGKLRNNATIKSCC